MKTFGRIIILMLSAAAIFAADDEENNGFKYTVIELPEKKETFVEFDEITAQLYTELRDFLSGSWGEDVSSPDGERMVSWGKVKYINKKYLIIDFQMNEKSIIYGYPEGGWVGVDRFIAEVIRIRKEENGNYRFTYHDTLDSFEPDRRHEIVLKYNSENDTIAITEYYGSVIPNPKEMVRVSEPLFEP